MKSITPAALLSLFVACNDITQNYYIEGSHEPSSSIHDDECLANDGAYCEPDGRRNGVCVSDICVSCQAFVCGGIVGCTGDKRFALDSGNVLDCPSGCFPVCAM